VAMQAPPIDRKEPKMNKHAIEGCDENAVGVIVRLDGRAFPISRDALKNAAVALAERDLKLHRSPIFGHAVSTMRGQHSTWINLASSCS
jgi:hypothetical protein